MTDLDDAPVTQENVRAVMSIYFEENGLMRQQLDSFDEFNSLEIIRLIKELQYLVGHKEIFDDDGIYKDNQQKVLEIRFKQEVYLSNQQLLKKTVK